MGPHWHLSWARTIQRRPASGRTCLRKRSSFASLELYATSTQYLGWRDSSGKYCFCFFSIAISVEPCSSVEVFFTCVVQVFAVLFRFKKVKRRFTKYRMCTSVDLKRYFTCKRNILGNFYRGNIFLAINPWW